MDNLTLRLRPITKLGCPVKAVEGDVSTAKNVLDDIINVQRPNAVPVKIGENVLPVGLTMSKMRSDESLKLLRVGAMSSGVCSGECYRLALSGDREVTDESIPQHRPRRERLVVTSKCTDGSTGA